MRAVAWLCVAALLACGGDDSEGEPQETEYSEDDGIRIQGKTAEGEFSMETGRSAKLPESFPDDVYVYEGATVAMVMQVATGQSVTLQSSDDPGTVADRYAEEMAGQGWSEQSRMDMGPQKILTYTKGERMAIVTVGMDGDQTNILLAIEGR